MSKQLTLAALYQSAHNEMRNVDGLQPQEALDELLKYLFFKEHDEATEDGITIFDGFASPAEIGRAASAIRARFAAYVARSKVVPVGWQNDGFLLSDLALAKVHAIFQGTKLLKMGLDLRSSALRQFISGPIRKGLGIFLTPDEVVRAIVEAISPKGGEKILDPACGSGTFLFESVTFVGDSDHPISIYGIDKNPRMMLLAEFNCGHLDQCTFQREVADSLAPIGSENQPKWFKPEGFDVILTNPPFGVSVDARGQDFASYTTCVDDDGYPLRSQGSEIMFIERCLNLLRPGGRMGIVLPRSVLTNNRLQVARQRLAKLGAVRAVISLPHETFAATGTQTTTAVLIVEKYGADLSPESSVKPALARIENVGFDTTGRTRQGSQLDGLGASLKTAMQEGVASHCVQVLEPLAAGVTFTRLTQILSGTSTEITTGGRTVADLVQLATTGKTPPRNAYADEGLFLVKVGNLTGAGISWVPRDRNFISEDASYSTKLKDTKRLRTGDLVLTSSAHASKYIAKKIDIVTYIPNTIGGSASFVGEVMLLRPRLDVIDPYLLLAYLRCESVVTSLQDRVKGQTAHLHPRDVLELPVDEELLSSRELGEIADILRSEAQLNDQLNELAFRQMKLQQALVKQPGSGQMLTQ